MAALIFFAEKACTGREEARKWWIRPDNTAYYSAGYSFVQVQKMKFCGKITAKAAKMKWEVSYRERGKSNALDRAGGMQLPWRNEVCSSEKDNRSGKYSVKNTSIVAFFSVCSSVPEHKIGYHCHKKNQRRHNTSDDCRNDHSGKQRHRQKKYAQHHWKQQKSAGKPVYRHYDAPNQKNHRQHRINQ